MIKEEMSTELASRNVSEGINLTEKIMKHYDNERMVKYKSFAVWFLYPEESLFELFPQLRSKKEKLMSEHDRLFRSQEIWLYTTEYLANNEFQRANYLADIMGFYKAFGTEPNKDRADLLSNELEFMYYLILKKLYAIENYDAKPAKEKALICINAQKKFFKEHLHEGAKKIAEKIIKGSQKGFYKEKAVELLEFMEEEERFLKKYK